MLSNIIVGVVTGLVSSWLTLLVSRMQRVWERKSAAYRELLEALQQMKAANDEEYNNEVTYRSLGPDRLATLADTWNRGKAVAYKYADIGGLDVDPSVEKIMGTLRDELDNHAEFQSLFESLDHSACAIGKALRATKEIAIQDARQFRFLRVPRWLASIKVGRRRAI